MKYIITLCTFCFSALVIYAQDSASTIINNTNVIDVRNGKIRPGMSVIIKNETIVDVIPSGKLKPDPTARLIEGKGKYVMPGMVDGHIHFSQSGGLYTRPDGFDFTHILSYEKERHEGFNNTSDYLKRYLRCGVTTVADVGGPFTNFIIRDSIAKKFTAPHVLVTGPLFSMIDNHKLDLNDPIIVKTTSIQAADSLLDKLLPYKPDYIKVWYIVTPELPAEKSFPVVKHIADRTHAAKLKLAVHATEATTASLAVDAGADILVHSVDDQVLSEQFIKKLVDKKVTYIPTLIVGPNWFKTGLGTPDNHRQDLRWANPFIYGTILDPLWIPQEKWPANLRKFRAGGMPPFAKSLDSVMAVNLKKVVAAGVNVVTGTDAGNPGTMHGSSYLQELEAMERAGMSTAQIIRSATVNAANAFSLNSGTVEKGKIADLLLLTKNPLEKLDHLNSIETIFRSGKMIQADTILREGPEMLVQRQLIAYNAGNIDAFLDTYSDDVILYSFPDSVLEKGKDNMRKMYSPMFNNPKFKPVQIVNRMVVGNKVIDHERVVYGNRTINAVAIYEVRDGKIVKVTFLE